LQRIYPAFDGCTQQLKKPRHAGLFVWTSTGLSLNHGIADCTGPSGMIRKTRKKGPAMPSCYWSLCDCPKTHPCPEHDGTGCSVLNGKQITTEADVDDAVTRSTEAAIAQLQGDVARLTQIRNVLQAKKAQLEKERSDLEQQSQAATNRAERQAVIDQQRAIAAKHANLSAEITGYVNEIDGLGTSYVTAATTISTAIVLPYSDPAGYCACYQAKLADLNRLSGLITTEMATLAAATASLNAAKTAVVPKLKFTLTVATGVVLIVFIILGFWAGLAIAAFLSLMFVALTVVGLAIQLGVRQNARLVSRIALLGYWLSYYRVQQVPTCLKAVHKDHARPEHADHR
jgi:hypothetical protein